MSEEQLQILELIRDYPLLTAHQLCRLTGRSYTAVQETLWQFSKGEKPLLQKLRENMYSRYVYALSRKGAEQLGGKFHDLSDKSVYFLAHERLANEALVEIATSYEIELHQQGREAWDTSEGIRPDKFLVVRSGERRRAFFLEAETGKNKVKDYLKKIAAYVRYREKHFAGKPENWKHPKYAVKTFSVLTVAPSENEAQELAVLATPLIPKAYSKLFLFSGIPITDCLVPHEAKRYDLMEG
jgi:hypothetical protein